MAQHYPVSPLNAMPQGMPVIPPRMQHQEQQRALEKQRQLHHQQQHLPPLQTQGFHSRSRSNGNSPRSARPLEGMSPTSKYNHNYNHNHNYNGSSFNSNNNITAITTSGRLRSGSNPAVSSSGYSNSGHYRTNSSGSSANGHGTGGTHLAARSNTTGSSFQERMKERDREKQQRERDEREAAIRAIREDPVLNATAIQPASGSISAVAAAQSTGTALWNRLRAAKDVINATITGEERWPESDDSDYEGESHVKRVLREYADKKETEQVAAKIAELEMTPVTPIRSGSNRNQQLRDMLRRQNSASNGGDSNSPPSSSLASPSSPSSDKYFYVHSVSAKDGSGHQASRSEDSLPSGSGNAVNNAPVTNVRIGNRFRTSSDASLSEALGRLEGKRNQDALVAQVSHLGSTRARSPHRGHRAYKDNIDVEPPPPLPTPKSTFRQQLQQQQTTTPPSSSTLSASSSSSRRLNNLGAYGSRKQQQQQNDYI
ncbi:hypothetical protein EDD11_004350 [Mortierella claussenii]|nr:hypothetical protein EDD11_004350 [Mortierella claussenii]